MYIHHSFGAGDLVQRVHRNAVYIEEILLATLGYLEAWRSGKLTAARVKSDLRSARIHPLKTQRGKRRCMRLDATGW